ncbi:MAG: hypothetical protein ACJA00_002278 [Myxococcota bacterium]
MPNRHHGWATQKPTIEQLAKGAISSTASDQQVGQGLWAPNLSAGAPKRTFGKKRADEPGLQFAPKHGGELLSL